MSKRTIRNLERIAKMAEALRTYDDADELDIEIGGIEARAAGAIAIIEYRAARKSAAQAAAAFEAMLANLPRTL